MTEDIGADRRLSGIRRQLLDARDTRQAAIARAACAGGTVVFASTGIPGWPKCPPGAARLLGRSLDEVARALPAVLIERGLDALGPWAALGVALPPDTVKQATIGIESSLPDRRLLDLDVYSPAGRQVDRAAMGVPPRACLVCDRPAVECIRLARHAPDEVSAAAARLLLRGLASALVDGARAELDLTPKPGLVDRLDNGSHADLSFEAMSRSIDLLPAYFDELAASAAPLVLEACVAAGRRAERRMEEAIGTNAHKGYIFLAGLALLAAATATDPSDLRPGIAALGRRILGPRDGRPTRAAGLSHGERARSEHALGGIHREAIDGLPSVFDHGLPVLSSSAPAAPWPASDTGGSATPYRLMAVLMQEVEDTTAVHRCGTFGLARLRADGLRLQQQIDEGHDYLAWLAALNDEYRRINLTMGGVADCMALCFALHAWLDPLPSPLAPHPSPLTPHPSPLAPRP